MYKSIFYKEWIKTRFPILLLCIVFFSFSVYTVLKTSQIMKVMGSVSFIENIIQKDNLLIHYLKYLPLIAGCIIAIVQFIPEMQNKRLKLTLHLPMNESRILAAMLFYGFGVILILFILLFLITLFILSISFPKEIIVQNFFAGLPWFLAGISGYFLSSWICLEPTWKQKIINTLPSLFMLYLFFIDIKSGGYSSFLPYLIVFILISFFFSYYSMFRFKDGVQ